MQKSFTMILVAAASVGGLTHEVRAGHTRPGYVDGCQSSDGRFVPRTVSVATVG